MTALANRTETNPGPAGPFRSDGTALAAIAAVVGPVAYVLVTLLHPAGVHGNDHPAVFREYAASQPWIVIHLAQLLAMIVALGGIAGLAVSMLRHQEKGRVVAAIAAGFAVISVPIAAVLQAVDGVALKRAVDAWLAAGGEAGSPSFAAAEAMRWLEHGTNAAFGVTQGLAVVLAASAMILGRSLYPRWMGWTGVGIGCVAVVSATLVAAYGFSHAAQAWGLARNPLLWIWTAAAGVVLWRRTRDLATERDGGMHG